MLTVDEMNAYIKGGNFNGEIALKNWSGSEFNSQVFFISGGTFSNDPSEFVDDDYKAVQEGNVWTIQAKEPVVKIGTIEYASLKKAVNEAKDGETITFIADLEQTDGVLITDKNITIDLNGKTFTVSEGSNTNNRNFKINGSSVVTIKNGTMVAAGEYSNGAYGTVRTEGTANVTLKNVKLYNYRANGLNVKALSGTTVTVNDSEVYSNYGGSIEAAGGTINLNNVKIEQKGIYSNAAWNSVAIGVNGGGKVTINSGNYSASAISTDSNAAQGTWVAYVMSSGGTLEINGGTFNGTVAETAAAANACGIICADHAAIVNINGGTFNSNGAILDMRNNVGTQPNPVATLAGGTFSADPRVSGLYSSNLISVADGCEVVKNEDGTWTVKIQPVAMIGSTKYTSLQEAFNVGGEITLYRDLTLTETVELVAGKSATLDLNGKKITSGYQANSDSKHIYPLDIYGELTIKDTKGNGTIWGRGIYVRENSKLKIEGGSIYGIDSNGGSALFQYGGEIIIDGGHIEQQAEGTYNYAINAGGGTVTMNGGWIGGNHGAIAAVGANVVINAGDLVCTGTEGMTDNVVYSYDNGSITINGGNFTADNDGPAGGACVYDANGKVTINGGYFSNSSGGDVWGTTGTVIKGGKFEDLTETSHIAKDYQLNEDGTVTKVASEE